MSSNFTKTVQINLPSSKSYANRALICSALADGQSVLYNIDFCDDVYYMVLALKSVGIKISKKKDKILIINGGLKNISFKNKKIYVGNAGTVMRFLSAFLGIAAHKTGSFVILDGSDRMRERPMKDLIDSLLNLSIDIQSIKNNGCPPVRIKNKSKNNLLGGETKLKGNVSSQYLSSILLSAPYFDIDTKIDIVGDLTSKPYVDMTIDVMESFGVLVENKDYKSFYIKSRQRYGSREYRIEADASSAGYFVAASAITGIKVDFPDLNPKSKQGDIRFFDVIEDMKSKDGLVGIDIDMNSMPDMVPTLAVLAMFANGETIIKNVSNLRVKETDRLRALAVEISKFGVRVLETNDGLKIKGRPNLNPSCRVNICTYNDHRMAMSFAVAKLRCPDIIIDNPLCVSKSFPLFWREWEKINIMLNN